MEQLAIFEEKVILSPADLRPEITSFDDILLAKLKETLEGKCSRHGYVIPGSLELLSRSMGTAEKGHFTSDFIYYMKVQGKVYNPPDGLQVDGEVVRKNKMGLYVIINDAIRIMVPRDLHIGNEEFDSIDIGDKIRIEIKKSRFQVNDTHILSIGQWVSTGVEDTGVEDTGVEDTGVKDTGTGAEDTLEEEKEVE
jgi:DNA-directed RNA polymerase subunit E'/Rpb7